MRQAACFLVLLLTLGLQAAETHAAADSTAAVHIVVLGSSTAAGYGPSDPDSAWVNLYRSYVQDFNPYHQITNLATGGLTTYEIMPTGFVPPPERPEPATQHNITRAISLGADAVIINLPSNDASRGFAVTEQVANYDSVVAFADQFNVPVWISTTQPRNLDAAGRANLMEMRDSTFALYGEFAIDFWNGLANPDGTINPLYDAGDGIHLNDSGHAILYERVVADSVLGAGSEPPVVATTAASGVTATSAQLNGTVDAVGLPTVYYFEYGLDTNYGTQIPVPAGNAGSDSIAVAVSQTATELVPGTEYHYRLVAQHAWGLAEGTDETFTTLPAPPVATTDPASNVTTVSADLNGTVTPNGQATSYYFEYGLDTSYGTQVPVPAGDAGSGSSGVAVLESIGGLVPNTGYHYRLVATNVSGTSFGLDETFTTLPAPPVVTTDPASSVTTVSADLNGTVNPNWQATTYFFEYGLDTSYGTQVPVPAGDAGSGSSGVAVLESVGGLIPNTEYHYRLVATNGSGTTNGLDETFTTLPAPPVVTTDPASSVTTVSADLNGTVNPNSQPTTYTFEYGLDTSYGTQVPVPAGDAGSGSSGVAVLESIGGLIPNTEYHYRLVATNGSGTTNGLDETFSTEAAPPIVMTEPASSVTTVSADLNGTVNPNWQATTYYFEYGPDTSYGAQVPVPAGDAGSGSTSVAVLEAVAGLLPSTEYHYRLVAVNDSGTTIGLDETFVTEGAPPTATTDPATNVTAVSADLNGTVNPNSEATTYYFEYGLDTSYGTQVPVPAGDAGSGSSGVAVLESISGLLPSTEYHYRLVATNGSGTTNGLDETFTTDAASPTVTTNPATGITNVSATLNGTVNPNSQPTTYTFEYGLDTGYGTQVPVPAGDAGSGSVGVPVQHSISGLTPNSEYHFRLVATNDTGTSFGLDETFTTVAAPPVVTTNAASNVTTVSAQLNGTVNPAGQPTTYTFEYGLDTSYGTQVPVPAGDAGSGWGAIPVLETIAGLTPNTQYHYRLVATNGSGSTNGLDETFTTVADPPVATTDPASDVTTVSAQLNGTVDAAGQPTTYTFEYGLDTSYGTQVPVPAGDAGSDSAAVAVLEVISGLIPNTEYHYRLVATNGSGTSTGLDEAFTTLPAPPVVTTDPATNVTVATADLNGTVNPAGQATTYYFEYGLDTSYGTQVPVPAGDAGSGSGDVPVTESLAGLTADTEYHYRLVATNGSGTSFGLDETFTTVAAPPVVTTDPATNITTVSADLNGTVNPAGQSTSYYFEYGLDTGYGTQVPVPAGDAGSGSGDVPVTESAADLIPNTEYHYRVVATNASGTTYGLDETFTTAGAPPTATTDPATNITTVSADLNGTVNPAGQSTSYYFEYGLDTGYGTQVPVPAGDAGSGWGDVDVSQSIADLTPNTEYHYRVVATNTSGTTYGLDETFTTVASPPVVTTQPATSVTTVSADLNGTVNPAGQATTYYFEYGLDTSYGTQVPVPAGDAGSGWGANPVLESISGLIPNTEYHYRLVATNGSGTATGLDQSFTTLAAPPVVTTDAASNVTTVSADLNGTVNPNWQATTYYFEYGPDTSYGTQVPVPAGDAGSGSVAVPVLESIGGLIPNTEYHYRLVATNGSGTSYGLDEAFTTVAAPPVATTNPATDVTVASAMLNGTVDPVGQSTTYFFEYGLDTSYGTQAPVPAGDAGSGSVPVPVAEPVSGLAPSTEYHYRLVATNGSGTSYGSDETFTTASAAPIVTTDPATDVKIVSARLNGTVNPQGEPTTYIFEYGLDTSYGTQVPVPAGDAGSDSTASPVSELIAGLQRDTEYHYRLVATNVYGTTFGSDLTFTTLTGAPGVVTGPAVNVTAATATLTGGVNPFGEATTYYFEYGLDTSYGTQVPVPAADAGSDTLYTDVNQSIAGLMAGTEYHYRLVATNAWGTTTGSDESFVTLAVPPTATTGPVASLTQTSAELTGTVNPQGQATTYYFEYGLTTSYGTQAPVPAGDAGAGTADVPVQELITDLTPDTLYHYRLVAVNISGTTNGLDATFTTSEAPPAVVTGPATSIALTSATLNGSVNPMGYAATYYFEYGLDTNYGTQVPVPAADAGSGSSAVPVSQVATGLTANTEYHYRLVATNAWGTVAGADSTFRSARVWHLEFDGTGDAATIQDAITLANDGDVVELADGTYTGVGNYDVDFLGRAITVCSESNDPTLCIVDAQADPFNERIGFYFHNGEDSSSVLQGITIKNAYSSAGLDAGRSAVTCLDTSPTIRDCILTDNWSRWGGAIGCASSQSLIENCEIKNSENVFQGAGGITLNNAAARVVGCVVTGCTGEYAGGICTFRTATTISGCTISGNTGAAGGVFFGYGAHLVLTDCVITGNATDYELGGLSGVSATGVITGCTISNNSGASGGGGLYVTDAVVAVERTIIWGNCAPTPAEIYLDDVEGPSTVTLECCLTDSTQAGGAAGLVYGENNVFEDPLFCDPEGCASIPTTAGYYYLDTASPCAPAHSPCGQQIGALPVGCGGGTGVEEIPPAEALPTVFEVLGNAPNPFRGSTQIRFDLPARTPVRLTIYDVTGRLVRTLVSETVDAGRHQVRWDGRNSSGAPAVSGVYFYRIEAGHQQQTKRMILLR